MKDLNLTEVFCEILSGLALLICVIPILDLAKVLGRSDIYRLLATNLSLSLVSGIVITSYVLGILVDAIGFALGEGPLGRYLNGEPPTAEERSRFWRSVPEHVLSYLDRQWAYFSCYRNLFLLTIPNAIAWGCILWRESSRAWLVVVVMAFLLTEIILFVSMRGLLGIYYRIMKDVATP